METRQLILKDSEKYRRQKGANVKRMEEKTLPKRIMQYRTLRRRHVGRLRGGGRISSEILKRDSAGAAEEGHRIISPHSEFWRLII
jgi:hypothetical protein